MARPPKNAPNSGPKGSASTPPTGPTPAEIVAREKPQRRQAMYAAAGAVAITIVCVILEHLLSSKVPDFHQTDLVQTMAGTATGQTAPRSFLTAVGGFKIDHGTETTILSVLRGLAYLLMIPVIVLLLRAARARKGTLGKFLEPIVMAGFVLMAVGTVAAGFLEPAFYRHAKDMGFTPGDIRDAYKHSSLVVASIPLTIGALGAGVPVALASIQSFRVGILPTYIGYMGVLIGMLFILPFEPTGILRAFWLSLVGAVFVGGLGGGLLPAWATGEGVLAEPRAPRQPKQPVKARAPRGGKSAGASSGTKGDAGNADAAAALPADGKPAGKPKAITDKKK